MIGSSSYWQNGVLLNNKTFPNISISIKITDHGRTRTCNPQIRSLVPYPLGHAATVTNTAATSHHMGPDSNSDCNTGPAVLLRQDFTTGPQVQVYSLGNVNLKSRKQAVNVECANQFLFLFMFCCYLTRRSLSAPPPQYRGLCVPPPFLCRTEDRWRCLPKPALPATFTGTGGFLSWRTGRAAQPAG